MASSSSSPAAFDQQRPLKRPRSAQDGQQSPPGQVIDHIFIADGVTSTKKAGVKKKRGCAEICPTGVLVSGKGTRFILANTEQLHGKIHEMSERIRVLEDALGSTHRKYEGHIRSCPSQEQYASVDDEEAEDQAPSHPLLQAELLNIKSTMGLYTASGTSQGNGKPPELASGQRSGGQAMDVDHSSDRERASSEDTITVPDVHSGDQDK
ncbi:hypothetical protein EST38_g5746 [Candolleomyces aberdarensis]|uniref:Uncharacterized protein n=1 Tax=Candolleomyces aberdarensis TaxID=2316362 RepID=A0A4Q2DN03_9AGAR|nr:hypothetical protein EST38_g5746 [Candolleomyces aberdarensis]